MGSILDDIHSPKDCLLLIAFPLSREAFMSDLESNSPKDYAKTTAKRFKLKPWALYDYHHSALLKCINDTAAAVSQLGATVKLNTELKNLAELSAFKVVNLQAHYNDGLQQIELSDGLHAVEAVVSAFDSRFAGILDLSVCNSTILQDLLKAQFGDQFYIKANRELAEIRYHLVMYKQTIRLLAGSKSNYLVESITLRKKMIEHINNIEHG